MSEDLDTLLKTPLATPPEAFTARVMRGIENLPAPRIAKRPERLRELAEWLGAAAAVAAGISQLAAFALSIWTVSNAG